MLATQGGVSVGGNPMTSARRPAGGRVRGEDRTPTITIGRPGVRTLDGGWTLVTADGSPSADMMGPQSGGAAR
jgi:hypothetical protein